MAVKSLTLDQCNWMHQRYPPPECCLCNAHEKLEKAEARIKELEALCAEALDWLDESSPSWLRNQLKAAGRGEAV